MKKLIYGGLFLAIVGMLFVGCKKEVESSAKTVTNKSIPKDVNDSKTKITEVGVDMTDYLMTMLNSNDIYDIKFKNKNDIIISFGDNSKCQVNIIDDFTELKLNNKTYRIKFKDGIIYYQNITDNIKTKYENLSGVTEQIGKEITIAYTINYYLLELGDIDYDVNPDVVPEGMTEWCFGSRKSHCSRAHIVSVITTYCGGTPSNIGNTDYGCVWGDFGCVGVTDFDC